MTGCWTVHTFPTLELILMRIGQSFSASFSSSFVLFLVLGLIDANKFNVTCCSNGITLLEEIWKWISVQTYWHLVEIKMSQKSVTGIVFLACHPNKGLLEMLSHVASSGKRFCCMGIFPNSKYINGYSGNRKIHQKWYFLL